MATLESTPELVLIDGDFKDKSVVSIDQFERADIELLLQESSNMAQMVEERSCSDLLDDKVIANLFYQPSTRTFLSFEAAAQRLGAKTISTQGVEYSSISKGETLEDTIRTVERYADTIALRHGDKGAAATAAHISLVPVINGGDGVGEHPSQAFLDLYTIQKHFNTADGLTVTMVGDLKHGRTVHSLARLLALYDVKLNYVSPQELSMPADITEKLNGAVEQKTTADLHEVIETSDIVYMTRTQEEYFDNTDEYDRLKNAYSVDPEMMRLAKPHMRLMHPLPRSRNHEIHPAVDSDPRATYFDQVENGMYVRMGLLSLVNGRSITEDWN